MTTKLDRKGVWRAIAYNERRFDVMAGVGFEEYVSFKAKKKNDIASKKKKSFIHNTIAVSIAAIVLFFSSCKNDISVVKFLTIKEKSPTETTTKMHLYFSEVGMLKNEFLFDEMNKYETYETYSEYPKGLEAHSYNEKGEREVTLTANYGKNYEAKKIMEVKYNVVITNHKTGEIIETEHLLWDMDKHFIYSNTQTKQTKADGSIYIGDRFEANEDMSKYKIFNPKIIRYAEE